MESPNSNSLRTVFNRYGPTTDRSDIAAGYAAVIGAIFVSALYITSVWFVESGIFDLSWSPYFAALEFNWVVYSATVGLAFAVPASFLVGAVGWRIVPTQTTFSGALKGAVGAVATYFVAFVPIAAVVFVMEIASSESVGFGIAITNALELSGLFVAVGFMLTWWLAIPVGCLVGLIHAARHPTPN
ncbi:hypothetical protein [Halobiforma nitratireducens]|uniref:hypothetical protein n=1 Tax=Halobiforma nitratireducens TaxID=130048 RepID=UPI00067765B7|nr:hypothetical protein [Halobiforma nitratireducens]